MTTTAPTRPGPVDLLQAFVNTLDVYEGTDRLSTRAELTRWLHENGLLVRRTPSSDEDLALARRLRAGLRDAMMAHHDGAPVESPDLTAATGALPLRMDCAGGDLALRPLESGVRAALAELLVAVEDARVHGDWDRLKVCRDEGCREGYYDGTKNRSKSWCGPGCSNKAKTRSYRERQRQR